MGQSSTPVPAIVERVAAHERAEPEELPSLANVVSPDTFARLTTAWADQTEPIEFTYVWYRVTVYPGGEVIVTP